VEPANATNQTITWTVTDAGGTGAVIVGSTLTTTGTGTVTVTATIANGLTASSPYTQEFTITVSATAPAFIGVTNISGVPGTATAGTPLSLSGTVSPGDATNKTITWTVTDAGSTGAVISGSTLTATATGTVTITATVANGLTASSPYTKDFVITVSGPAGPGSGGTLTINGLPSGGTRAVYVFSSGTDISTYEAISSAYLNGSYQAVGVSLNSAATDSFTLYTWSGGAQGGDFGGNGNYPVLLLNSSGSISDSANPMYAQATVSFSNGAGTVSYGDFTAVVSGGSGSGGTLTISGLPAGGVRGVYIFSSGTDISTYEAISSAYLNGSYQAVGVSLNSAATDTFTLYTWSGGAQGGGFTGNGNYPVLLLNSSGSVTDTANPMYARATVSFSNGVGTISYSGFTAVVSGGTPTVTTVTVNPATASVDKGETRRFTATVTGTGSPAQTVTWTVSGNDSAGTTISANGTLTVAANETAASLTVRATSTADSSKYGTATVTVTGEASPTVTTVTVNPATASVDKGETRRFTATVTGTGSPAQTVTWTLSGNDSAGTTISADGTLTVAATETAASLTVRATSTVDSSKYGTATVTVQAADQKDDLTVVLRGMDEEIIDLSRNTDNDLSKSSYNSLIVTIEGSYDSIRWYLDGGDRGAGSSYTVYGSSSIAIGLHYLTVVVVKNGVPYSNELTFRVVQ
jgi:uncharacterized protein YjdB